MHIEIQVALNFVISYLYNKLPRRRVNIFGEELEKALRDKFQGHWYPEKPFKGSAFRCLKTGDPTDAVIERAARESGVPVSDILENLPHELSVWVDPGEVSYRIGEKGAVKILYSENSDNHEDNTSADREVTKTFNPEAQCFRPIDAINTNMNGLSISPKISPHAGSSPHSAASTSPTYKGSPNPAANGASANGNGNSFMQRSQASLTFTTATFAQTKFGSTKLKTNSKRANSSSYRMSPTEFSNYIKQRAIQQQMHHGHGPAAAGSQQSHFGPIGPVSPARSLSPNPMPGMNGSNAGNGDQFYFPNMANPTGMYPQFNGHRNMFDGHYHVDANNGIYGPTNGVNGASNAVNNANGKFGAYLEPHGFYGIGNHMQQHQQQLNGHNGHNQQLGPNGAPASPHSPTASTGATSPSATNQQQQQQQQLSQHLQKPGNISNNKANANNPANEFKLTNKDSTMAAAVAVANNKTNSTTITVTITNGANETTIAAANNTNGLNSNSSISNSSAAAVSGMVGSSANNQDSAAASSKLIDGLNSFYSNAAATASYQQLLVAN